MRYFTEPFFQASCEEVHRRCQKLVATLEDASLHMEPDEMLEANQLLSGYVWSPSLFARRFRAY